MSDSALPERKIATRAVHGGEVRPGPEGSIVFPIYQGTVYASANDPNRPEMSYLRSNNTPSQVYLHEKLASLEGAEAALATASGMAALTTTIAATLESGDHILAANDLYGGTFKYLSHQIARFGLSHSFVDPRNPDSWEAHVTPRTKMFLVETIGNPLMRIPELEAVVRFSRERGLTTLIDNTFASPVNFRPLDLGFDISFHSATKYLNGHSDLVAGCILGSAEIIDRVSRVLGEMGAGLDPHAGFLLARGLKTLVLRVRAQNANGERLAAFLDEQPKVKQVHYPGLTSHPDHERALSLLSGFGGMLSFELDENSAEVTDRVLERLQIAYVAPSLGSIETLVSRPAATSHVALSAEQRADAGISDGLVRVSCGIEDADDLIADFEQALEAI